jgi:hypothetical protein
LDIHHSIIEHQPNPQMQWDAFWLPQLVVPDAKIIQLSTLQVGVWAENASVGVSQWAAGTIVIW